jgi:hypothetical protein
MSKNIPTYDRVFRQMVDKLGSAPYNVRKPQAVLMPTVARICQNIVRHKQDGTELTKSDFYWLAELLVWGHFRKSRAQCASRRFTNKVQSP